MQAERDEHVKDILRNASECWRRLIFEILFSTEGSLTMLYFEIISFIGSKEMDRRLIENL